MAVDTAQSTLIRSVGTLTPDAVAMIRAMFARAGEDRSDSLWIGLAAPTRAELLAVGEVFSIPRLWLDDALNPRQRAKAEFEPDGRTALFVFKIVTYHEPTSAIETGQITLMVGPSFVVTVRLGPVGALGKVRTEITSRPEFLAHGPLAAVHGIIDAIVDDYLNATDEISQDIDTIAEPRSSPTASWRASATTSSRPAATVRRAWTPAGRPSRRRSATSMLRA